MCEGWFDVLTNLESLSDYAAKCRAENEAAGIVLEAESDDPHGYESDLEPSYYLEGGKLRSTADDVEAAK